jgi:hypothetical protein
MFNPESRPSAMWEHRIRQRAHEIYEARVRNGISGTDWEDWFEAERVVLAEIQGSKLCGMHLETLTIRPEQKAAVETKLQDSGLHVDDVEKLAQGHSVSPDTAK